MSKDGINIPLTSDGGNFVQSVEQGVDKLEDFQDALDDVAKEGDKAAEKLEQSFSDTVAEVKALGEASESAGRRSRKGSQEASDGLSELKDEGRQTAMETAASFDGSAESIIGAFQEVAAKAFAGFGPAGAAAGLAAAAGIGIAINIFESLQEQEKQANENAAELAATFIETGHDGSEAIQNIVDRLKEMATATEDGETKLKDINNAARIIEGSFRDLALAYAGNTDALDEQIQKLKQQKDELTDNRNAAGEYVNEVGRGSDLILDNLDSQINKLEQVQTEVEKATELEQLYAETGAAALQTKADAIDQINTAYDDVVGSVTDYLNAETGILDVEAYLDAVDQRRQALIDYQNNLAQANLTPEQIQALNDMGLEAASALLDAYTDPSTTAETKRRISKNLEDAAKEASGVANSTLDTAFGKGVETKLKIDTSDAIAKANADLQRWTPDEKTLRLRLNITDQYGRPLP